MKVTSPALLTFAAAAQSLREVTNPDELIHGFCFLVLPSSGDHWVIGLGVKRSTIVFAKADPEHRKSKGPVLVLARRFTTRNDISTSDQLVREIGAIRITLETRYYSLTTDMPVGTRRTVRVH